MRYEEPKVQVVVPITLLRRIRDCLQTELETFPYDEKNKNQRIKRRKSEKAIMIVSDAIIDYDVKKIVGDSLEDECLQEFFPQKRKRQPKKKQHD